tara:strand:+ start:1928 stop:2644 length:717 start_codon:yes stop_codon:yes gene_type:complete
METRMDDDISYLLLDNDEEANGLVTEAQLLRLSEHMTIPTAAACIVGIKPSYTTADYCSLEVSKAVDSRPCITPINAALGACYESLRTAIILKTLSAQIEMTPFDYDTAELCPEACTPQEIDWLSTYITRQGLITWLDARGLRAKFFFAKNDDNASYLDPEHPRFSPKLAASVKAWLAFEDSELYQGKGVTDALREWLEVHYKKLGLTHQNKKSQNAIEQVVSVTNWNLKGGSPKTPG